MEALSNLDPDAQNIVAHAVARLDEELGAEAVAHYLIGSQADGTAVSLSDVDMVSVLQPSATGLLATGGILAHQLTLHHPRLNLVLGSVE